MYYGKVSERVLSKVCRGFLERFHMTKSTDPSQVSLEMKVESRNDLWEIVPLTLIIEEYLVLQWVHVWVMAIELVNQLLL